MEKRNLVDAVRLKVKKFLEYDKAWLNRNQRNIQEDVERIRQRPQSFPMKMTLALSNVCNYACAICSVQNLRKK